MPLQSRTHIQRLLHTVYTTHRPPVANPAVPPFRGGPGGMMRMGTMMGSGPTYTGGYGRGGSGGYGGIPPPTYICHRCKQPGHYIKNCPTNGDPAFEPQRVRHPVGIPTTFLQQVTEAPPQTVSPTNITSTAQVASAITAPSGAALLSHPRGGFATLKQNECVPCSPAHILC